MQKLISWKSIKPPNPHTLLTTRRNQLHAKITIALTMRDRMIRMRTSTRLKNHKETVCLQCLAIHRTFDALFPLSDTSRVKIPLNATLNRVNLLVSPQEIHSLQQQANRRSDPNVLRFKNNSPIEFMLQQRDIEWKFFGTLCSSSALAKLIIK